MLVSFFVVKLLNVLLILPTSGGKISKIRSVWLQESDKRLSSQQSTEKEAQLKREYEKQLASLQQQAQAARLESSQTASSSQQQRKLAEE